MLQELDGELFLHMFSRLFVERKVAEHNYE